VNPTLKSTSKITSNLVKDESNHSKDGSKHIQKESKHSKEESKSVKHESKKDEFKPIKEEPEEFMHWADKIALDVQERIKQEPILHKIVEKQGVLIYDEKTPSGIIHVGAGRGWIIHDVIAKAMRKAGMNARFVLSSDDIDPYDKPNKTLPADWNKYIGMPFRNMPSPVQGYENFGNYYFMMCVEKFEELGIQVEIESTGAEYEKGTFNKAIKKILDNHLKVQDIYLRLYGEEAAGAQKIPFNIICEKCGKIATTLATKWDKEKELLHYECKEGNAVVKWASGCGHSGIISPYDGNGKFPWKVEWAAKWPSKGVICEYAGKDHFTLGGSRTCAVAISSEILDYPPPYPSTRTETGKGYEFFNIGGKKMSTSKGEGIAFADITTILPPKIVRYLLVRARPHAVIDFDPNKDNDVIFLFDRYDECERVYFKDADTIKDMTEKEIYKQGRIYELSQTSTEIPVKMPHQISLTFAASVIQLGLHEEGALKILKQLGHIPEDISGIDLHYVMERLHDAKRWVDTFASENYKFVIQDKTHAETVGKTLTEKQRNALHHVAKLLSGRKYSSEDLHNEFYKYCTDNQLDMKEFFTAAYTVLVNRNKGPRLAGFVIALHDKAIELFKSV
jgi:lysyl-tRNA synthetase class 1